MRSRSPILRTLLLALLLLAVPLVAVRAQTTVGSFTLQDGRLRASIAVSNPPSERVVASLRDGLESEVQYNVRVYQRTGGLLGILGDKLVGEFQRNLRAHWDEFGRDYVISEDGRMVGHTRSVSEFLADFFNLEKAATGIRLNPADRYYVLSNARIQIVRLVPPLTMIAPLLPKREIDTPWVRTELP